MHHNALHLRQANSSTCFSGRNQVDVYDEQIWYGTGPREWCGTGPGILSASASVSGFQRLSAARRAEKVRRCSLFSLATALGLFVTCVEIKNFVNETNSNNTHRNCFQYVAASNFRHLRRQVLGDMRENVNRHVFKLTKTVASFSTR